MVITPKLFVSLELAKLLKDNGFNEPCMRFYDTIGKYEDIRTDPIDWNASPFVSIPTYQQVIDWFRENYNIRIVDSCSEGWVSAVKYRFAVLKIASNNGGAITDMTRQSSKGDSVFDDYYTALEYYIKFALNN